MQPTDILTAERAQQLIDHLDMTDRFMRNLFSQATIVQGSIDGEPEREFTQEEKDLVIEYYSGQSVQDTLREYVEALSGQ